MVTLSKCDKEEMGTGIKIAAELKPTTAAPRIRCEGDFLGGGTTKGCYLLLSGVNCSVDGSHGKCYPDQYGKTCHFYTFLLGIRQAAVLRVSFRI